jgi:hypothetical protein
LYAEEEEAEDEDWDRSLRTRCVPMLAFRPSRSCRIPSPPAEEEEAASV